MRARALPPMCLLWHLARLQWRLFADVPAKAAVSSLDKSQSTTEWSSSDGMAEVFALQGMRSHMEDRFCMQSEPELNIYLYGVFDGHGGEVSTRLWATNRSRRCAACEAEWGKISHE